MTAPERAPSAPTPDDHEGFAVTDAQLREVLAQEYLENARAVRSRSFTVPYAIMVIVLAFAPAIPRVSSILGGGIVITAPVFLGMLAIHLALVPLVRRNPKRYVAGDAFETAFHVAAYGLLIVSSGHALAIPWFFLSMNAQLAPLHPSRWVHRTAYATMPVVVAAVFEMRGQRDDALLSLVLGIAVLIILRVATSAVMERARSRVRIADLERKVERSRIAMELHDGIGADLTAVILRARTVADHAKDDDRETLDALVARLRAALAELRSIVWAVREPSVTGHALVTQLRSRAAELVPSPLQCSVTAHGLDDLVFPGELSVLVLRVVQESVNNAARHANASRVDVTVELALGELSIEISDDGSFRFNDEAAAAGRGHGLSNLRHRVEQAGGTFELAATTAGTCVRAVLPQGRVDRT